LGREERAGKKIKKREKGEGKNLEVATEEPAFHLHMHVESLTRK
jgi:hypothetical protein